MVLLARGFVDRVVAPLCLACVASLLAPGASAAPPSAQQVLGDLGFSAAEQQRMRAGEFVVRDVDAASERDLSVAMGFLVKTTPDDLARRIVLRELVSADPQVRENGELRGDGSAADLRGLQVSDAAERAFRAAKPGDALNLSAEEIQAFRALPPGKAAVVEQLQTLLLGRYRAYRARGLAGIAPYARGSDRSTDGGAELRRATETARWLAKYLPAMQQLLLRYPDATVPGLEEVAAWARYEVDGSDTYVLTQLLAAPEGDARVVVQRQYYVSRSYHAEQAIAGFLPVQEGTLVAYTNHTFTDQVTGFGGAAKRGIGRKMLASTLKQIFETMRTKVAP